MEILVWQLRANGEKLPKDALDGPHRGWLRMARFNVGGERTLHAGLYASPSAGAPTFLAALHHVEVRKLDERGLLLVGLQKDQRSSHIDAQVRQAWFCQPVHTEPRG